MKKELLELKEKVVALEAKVKELEARQVIHNHHHTYPTPQTNAPITWPQPYFGDPNYRITCGATAGLGGALTN